MDASERVEQTASSWRWSLTDPAEIAERFGDSMYLPPGRRPYRLDAEFLRTPGLTVEWIAHHGDVVVEEQSPGRQFFALIDDVPDKFEIGGLQVRPNSLIVASPQLRLARLRGSIRYTVLNVPETRIEMGSTALRHLTATTAQRRRMIALADRARRCARDRRSSSDQLIALSDGLHDALEAVVLANTPSGSEPDPDVAQQIVCDAVGLIRRGRATSVSDLTREIATSRSSLYRSFDRVLGMSPYAYMQRRRLICLRRRLLEAEYEPGVVTREAANVGAFHLGNLASRYRELFDELPHDTAVRRSTSPRH